MNLSMLKGFKEERLNSEQIKFINGITIQARKDVVNMITNTGSGHIGGSLSSIDIYTMLWLCAKISPNTIHCPERDRIVVSMGHTAAGVYSTLANIGYFDIKKVLTGFRKLGSIFEGHPSLKVPGVEWCSGSLGQGLSVGCGFAMASKIKRQDYHVFVVMGDGEQQKGQITEASEFAVKYGLSNITVIIDNNGLQASGKNEDIMPQNIEKKFLASGWEVFKTDGHDYEKLYDTLKYCYECKNKPTLIIAKTIMGKGVSFIENDYRYHGKALNSQQCKQAINELYIKEQQCDTISEPKEIFIKENEKLSMQSQPIEKIIKQGNPITYDNGEVMDCRSAFGEALYDIAVANNDTDKLNIAVFDCDLAESVKVNKFGKKFPNNLIECGIQEHNAATVAAALSQSSVLTFFADFGTFAIDETYGQHRMSDLNNTSLKLICTHVGLDVGEDGKTHQCLDYISLISNLFGFKIIIPADANQTDRIIRYAATTPGNIVIPMGRSKLPVLTRENGSINYDAEYNFEYGKADWIREGMDASIITCGTMVYRAVNAQIKLKERGINVGILNLSCPVELDFDKIMKAAETGLIITYEDHNVRTGMGSIIGNFIAENSIKCKFIRLGINQYGASASPECLYKQQGLDEDSLVNLLEKEVIKKHSTKRGSL